MAGNLWGSSPPRGADGSGKSVGPRPVHDMLLELHACFVDVDCRARSGLGSVSAREHVSPGSSVAASDAKLNECTRISSDTAGDDFGQCPTVVLVHRSVYGTLGGVLLCQPEPRAFSSDRRSFHGNTTATEEHGCSLPTRGRYRPILPSHVCTQSQSMTMPVLTLPTCDCTCLVACSAELALFSFHATS
jgi:hypothetical protein